MNQRFHHLRSFFAYFSCFPVVFPWAKNHSRTTAAHNKAKQNIQSQMQLVRHLLSLYSEQNRTMERPALACVFTLSFCNALFCVYKLLNSDFLPCRCRMYHMCMSAVSWPLYMDCSITASTRGGKVMQSFLPALFWKGSFVSNRWVSGNNTQPLQT